MSSRALTLLSADSDFLKIANEAAELAGDAIAQVVVMNDLAAAEQAVEVGLEGLVIVDPAFFPDGNLYEWTLRTLRRTRALIFVLSRTAGEEADALARFVGAQGALVLPIHASELAERFSRPFGPGRPTGIPVTGRELDEQSLRSTLGQILEDDGDEDRGQFLARITDPETKLYTAAYWEHRLEEEFKRAQRFRFPMGLAAISFDGEADEDTLLTVAGMILVDTRDIDIVGRLNANTIVALLPHTGPGGTQHFVRRVVSALREQPLHDLLGEPLEWAQAWSVIPDGSVQNAQEFLSRVLNDVHPLSV